MRMCSRLFPPVNTISSGHSRLAYASPGAEQRGERRSRAASAHRTLSAILFSLQLQPDKSEARPMKQHYEHYKLQLRFVVIQYPIHVSIFIFFLYCYSTFPLWFCLQTVLCFNFLGHVPASLA